MGGSEPSAEPSYHTAVRVSGLLSSEPVLPWGWGQGKGVGQHMNTGGPECWTVEGEVALSRGTEDVREVSVG